MVSDDNRDPVGRNRIQNVRWSTGDGQNPQEPRSLQPGACSTVRFEMMMMMMTTAMDGVFDKCVILLTQVLCSHISIAFIFFVGREDVSWNVTGCPLQV